ncbi:transcription initiation factor IIB [Haloplanus aerogenes]|uniref:Transcription initiation factor IIB n=1 Tax=Haloplanus aerogenes TaxID=660522 RepID=A0A3M0CHR1_9EURY|nr:TFIIB-type zinc ribbon-containing protein [Haloplanus aerogenes]AZH24790.1 transcription initiation factor IIB family protein [Haloplanus aerogenes]RMB08327.1 transcription initiation factor TFIIB [Haloplanus aerogenes]
MAKTAIYERSFDEESGKTIATKTCPECAGTLVTESAEVSCADCGLVIDEYLLDHRPDWNVFDRDTDSERTGAPLTPTRHDWGLSSEIGYGGDAQGTPLSGAKRRQIARLRQQHQRAQWQTTAERNLAYACSEIRRMAGALDLPRSVCEEASLLYRRAQRKRLIRGRSIEMLAAGSLYATCRCRGYPRTIAEVAEVTHCDQPRVARSYRVLNTELGLDAQLVTPMKQLSRFAAECEASADVRHRARELACLAEEHGLANGRHPAGVAAACLYVAGLDCHVNYTQVELAEIAGVTPVTLRDRYYELRDVLSAEPTDGTTSS